MPRISICIPTYCQIDYLRQTLNSVQIQTYEDYEIIISDDSPNDLVEQLVKTFDFGNKLTYYRNTVQLGSPENWNACIKKAKGNYIKLLHHDDRFTHPDSLSVLARMLDENPEASFAFCGSLVKSASNQNGRVHKATDKQLELLIKNPENLFFGNFIGAPSATIYRSNLGLEYDTDMKWLVDVDFYIRVLQINGHFAYSPKTLITTTSGALHQVTETCQNSVKTDFFEHFLLYKKISAKLNDNSRVRKKWFAMFEKYQIFNQNDLLKNGIKLKSTDISILTPFFEDYKKCNLARLPYRIYLQSLTIIRSSILKLRRH